MATLSHSSVVSQSVSRLSGGETKSSCGHVIKTASAFRHSPCLPVRREIYLCQIYVDTTLACPMEKLQTRAPECQGAAWLSSSASLSQRNSLNRLQVKLWLATTLDCGRTPKKRQVKGNNITQCVYGAGSGHNEAMGGDAQVQQMLVEMVQIQLGKARMSNFVDERSQHMRNIAQQAHQEYDRIAYRTMKGLDATESRVLRQLDADAHAIERELRITRAELEAQQKDFEEFQRITAYSRNEGLFFKNLYPAPGPLRLQSPPSKVSFKENVTVITPSRDFSSSYRQVLYGGLSLVIVSFLWSSSSALVAGTWMRGSKLVSYGIVFSLLLTQLAYVKVLVGEAEDDSLESDSRD